MLVCLLFDHVLGAGLIYRSTEAPVVLLCFYSGKVVLTGGKSLRDIEWGWNMLWKVVRRYIQ